MFDHPCDRKFFPFVWPEFLIQLSFQVASLASYFIPVCLWEEAPSVFSIPSHKVVTESTEVPLDPSLLKAEQTQFMQPLVMHPVCWSPAWLGGPVLFSLQKVHVFVVLSSLRLGAVPQMQSQKGQKEAKEHFVWCGSCTLANTVLLAPFAARAHCWRMFSMLSIRMPWSFSAKLFSRQLSPCLYCCMEIFPSRCRSLYLP